MINKNRLKKLRLKNEYKQIELANILGVGRSTYAKYETGTIQPPNDQVVKIAKLFKVSSDFLLDLSDDPTPKNEQKKSPDGISDEFDTIVIDGKLVKLEGQMNRIKELRENKNVRQIDLAEYLNIAQNTLSYWEQGKYDIDNKSLQKLAVYFETTTDYILGFDNNPTPPNKKELSPSEKAHIIADGFRSIGIDPDKLTEDELKFLLDFVDRNKDLIIKRANEIAGNKGG